MPASQLIQIPHYLVIEKTTRLIPVLLLLLTACTDQAANPSFTQDSPLLSMQQTGWLKADELNEASGLQASTTRAGDYFVHNDGGEPEIFVIDQTGADLGVVSIVPARNKDWEDLTSVPIDGGRWLVAGDIGDNMAQRQTIKLYFFEEPQPGKKGRYGGRKMLQHRLGLIYPDGARDCESMAYDPVSQQILLLSKRDKPPRLYAVALTTALTESIAELEFLGTIAALRPPTVADRKRWQGRTDWISQPTGLDISADGSKAVILTYRSVYRYHRLAGEDWLSALQQASEEVLGPPGEQNEAVAFSQDGKSIFVTSEQLPAAVTRLQFNKNSR